MASPADDDRDERLEDAVPARDLSRDARSRPVMADASRIEVLLAEARYHRHRFDLYRAKMYGSRPTTTHRFRELERASQAADGRLRRAQQAGGRPATGEHTTSTGADDG